VTGTAGGQGFLLREEEAVETKKAPSSARLERVLVPDLLLATLVLALSLVGSGVSLEDDFRILVVDSRGPWLPQGIGLLVMVAASLPLVLRRIAPLPVFAVVAAASVAYQVLGYRPEPLPLGALVALYTVAVARPPRVATGAAAAYIVALTIGSALSWTPLHDDQFYVVLVAAVATITLGYGVALGRAQARLAEQRAAELARDHDARMQAAVEQEQSRIAREVHDIVAHDVSVIVAQAAAARRVLDSQPAAAATTLASVETLGRDALDGVRRLVTLLRTPSADEEHRPQPTLERLPELVAQVQQAGLDVDLEVTGTPRPLPATTELNAFRIVQEALTNSLKHAGTTSTAVNLNFGEDVLRLEVCDHGRGGPHADLKHTSAGYGLISMQQRATMLGGRLETGPTADGGFRVFAQLPLNGGQK
jgi:signal transduction histidine kinase